MCVTVEKYLVAFCDEDFSQQSFILQFETLSLSLSQLIVASFFIIIIICLVLVHA